MSDPTDKSTARAELVKAKIAAGLRPEQAEAVVAAQEAEDAAAEKSRTEKPAKK